MGFNVVAPPEPLSALVEKIWDWDMPQLPHRYDRILPSAASQLVVNLAEDETRVYDEAFGCRRFAAASFAGRSSRNFIIDTAEQVRVVGVVFRPGCAAALFRQRMDLLSNDHVDLDALVDGGARGFRERLLEADGAAARLQVMHTWLEYQAANARPHAAIAHALRAFDAAPQVQRIPAIAAHCRLSPRRFGTLFREHVGMSPKRYARLVRFRNVVGHARQAQSVDWAGLAVDCGFHDQPHLAREFRAFSGLTPTAWMSTRGAYDGHVPIG